MASRAAAQHHRDGSVRNVAWGALAILCALYVVSTIDRQIIAMLVKPIERDLAIDDVAMGVLIGPAFGLFYTTAGLAMGLAVDRFPRRIVVFCGLMVWAVGAISCGLAHSYAELLVARFAVGLGEAALTPAAHAIISERFGPGRRALALSIFTVSNLVSSGAAVILGGVVVTFAATRGAAFSLPVFGSLAVWQFLFVITGVPGLFLAGFAWLLPERANGPVAPTSAGLRGLMASRGRAFWAVTLGCAIVTIGNYALSGWLPTAISRTYNLSAHDAGLWFAAILIVPGAIGQIASGAIVDRFVRRGVADAPIRYFALASLLGLPFGLGALLTTDVRACAALFMFYTMLVFPNLGYSAAALQAIVPPPLRGRASGVMLFAIGVLGTSLGTTIVGILGEHVFGGTRGLSLGLATIIAACVPLGVAIMWSGRRAYVAAVEANGADVLQELTH